MYGSVTCCRALFFWAHQRNLCILLKNVFRITYMLRTRRPWDITFSLTTQLWINFILRVVSDVLAFILVLTIPGLLIDVGDQCNL